MRATIQGDVVVRLLAPEVTVSLDGCDPKPVNGIAARLLARLAVRPGESVEKGELELIGWPEGDHGLKSLNDHLKTLRRLVNIPDSRRNVHTYVLQMPVEVDAVLLISAVGQEDRQIGLTELDELLGVCRGEPDDVRKARWWMPVARARAALLNHVGRLTDVERGKLTRLDEFLRLHPALRPSWSDYAEPVAKKRLLIVEDNPRVGRALEVSLRSQFECVLVTDFDGWAGMSDAEKRSFDGAVVDRHLTDSRDHLGEHVLDYLKSYTSTLAVMMTADPPQGFEQEAIEKYGVLGVYRKGEGAVGVNVSTVVKRMFGGAA
jgi:hypothetical protein